MHGAGPVRPSTAAAIGSQTAALPNDHLPAWLRRTGVGIACFTSLATPISTAAASIGKVLMLVFALWFLLWPHKADANRRVELPSVVLLLVLLAWFTLSLGWTVADLPRAIADIAKYGKLILIPTMMVLLGSRREALLGLACYAAAQVFVLVSSMLLSGGLHLPWVLNHHRLSVGSVFADYITQSIMTATFAALCWVARDTLPRERKGQRLALVLLALVSLFDTLYLMPGRTGWAVAAAMAALIAWWELPRRFRAAAVLAPVLVAGLLLATSPTGRERLTDIVSETNRFVVQGAENSSSGERLNFWRRSLESIRAAPWLGTGVGSWQTRYLQLEHGKPPEATRTTRNPHNEYLLIGVQIGVFGLLLFIVWIAAAAFDARRYDRASERAITAMAMSLAVAALFNSALFDSWKGSFYCIVGGLLFAYGASGPRRRPGLA